MLHVLDASLRALQPAAVPILPLTFMTDTFEEQKPVIL